MVRRATTQIVGDALRLKKFSVQHRELARTSLEEPFGSLRVIGDLTADGHVPRSCGHDLDFLCSRTLWAEQRDSFWKVEADHGDLFLDQRQYPAFRRCIEIRPPTQPEDTLQVW